jgi:hypothetical protein
VAGDGIMFAGKPNGWVGNRALAAGCSLGLRAVGSSPCRLRAFCTRPSRRGFGLTLNARGSLDVFEVIRGAGVMKRAALGFLFTLGAGRGEVLEHAAAYWPAAIAAAGRASSA